MDYTSNKKLFVLKNYAQYDIIAIIPDLLTVPPGFKEGMIFDDSDKPQGKPLPLWQPPHQPYHTAPNTSVTTVSLHDIISDIGAMNWTTANTTDDDDNDVSTTNIEVS